MPPDITDLIASLPAAQELRERRSELLGQAEVLRQLIRIAERRERTGPRRPDPRQGGSDRAG